MTPIIYLVHNVLPHEPRFFDSWLARWALGKASRYFVQTERERDRLAVLVPEGRIEIIAHPIYHMFADQRVPQHEAINQLGLPHDLPILLFFGIIRRYKGLEYLIDALAYLNKSGTKAFLVIAGEFWEDINLYQQQISRLNLQEQITIDNRYIPNEAVAFYFSAADIFVAPYIGATQSGAVKMAQGFRLPMVISDEVAVDSSLQESRTCQFSKAGDVVSLADAIERLIREKPARDEIPETETNPWNSVVTLLAGSMDI